MAKRSKFVQDHIDPNKSYVWTRAKQANGQMTRAGEPVDLQAFSKNKLDVFYDNGWIEEASHYEKDFAPKHHGASKAELEAEDKKRADDEAAAQEKIAKDAADLEATTKRNADANHKPYIKKFGRARFVVMLGEEKLTGEMSEAEAQRELEKLV
jgi:hypothetical protein